MDFNNQNNHQQAGPFWDFVRSMQQNSGTGVDQPSQEFNMWGSSEGPHEHRGNHSPRGAHGFYEFGPFGFPFGGAGPFGRGGFGPRGDHRGRRSFSPRGDGEHTDGEGRDGFRGNRHHGKGKSNRRGGEESGEETPTSDAEAGEGSSRPYRGPRDCKGKKGNYRGEGENFDEELSDVEAREGSQGQESRRGPKNHGRHGPGSRGGWGVRGAGRCGPHGAHHGRGGPHAWGGPHGHHGRRGPPPFASPGGPFDFSAMIQALSSHPIAQAFGIPTAQRSGETLVPEDVDAENSFVPPIDVFTTEDAYVLHIALPGAKKEDVGVHWDAEKGILSMAGVVYRQGDEKFLESLTKKERKVGAFERTMKLPLNEEDKSEIDGDNITAKLEDGVLVVTVPKLEKEESWTEIKRVDIN
ncbi:2d50b185-999f-4b5e-9f4f-f6e62869b1a1 [Sclerotinia trifoliorum]|uniref:2d50b185-999f-4b5e-9f4f-f6e62869b1a1 n=1 Tax=Sclerotinia trifoliorum TaxID=28548 RepID=A0A8H2ZVF6_9HELO|nr:2d50b185-999f-4b5e-9f4f-f6e62869b1a1 [Sclerotinia trifoliorum]